MTSKAKEALELNEHNIQGVLNALQCGVKLEELKDTLEIFLTTKKALTILAAIESGELNKTINDDDPHMVRIAKTIQNEIIEHLKNIGEKK